VGWRTLTSLAHGTIARTFGAAETIVYHADGYADAPIVAVFRAEHVAADLETESEVSTRAPRVGVRLSDLPRAPEQRREDRAGNFTGDQVTIDGVIYDVNDSLPDGEGWTELELVKPAP